MMVGNNRAAISLSDQQLQVTGELDFVTVVPLLTSSLPLLSRCAEYQFNLAGVTVCNSAALALLIEWRRLAQQNNKRIVFHNVPQQLLTVAAISGIKNILF